MKSGNAKACPGASRTSAAEAFMIVYMNVSDASWMKTYFADVPTLLAEYGATQLAGGKRVIRAEGDLSIPERIAIFRFPSIAAAEAFMEDERYRPYRDSRRRGSSSQILLLENAAVVGALV